MTGLDSHLHLQSYFFSSARCFQIETVRITFGLMEVSSLNGGTIIKQLRGKGRKYFYFFLNNVTCYIMVWGREGWLFFEVIPCL